MYEIFANDITSYNFIVNVAVSHIQYVSVLHVPVLLKDWWAVYSRPAGPPLRWEAPSLVDEWLSSKTPDNQQCAHRHQLAGSHLR